MKKWIQRKGKSIPNSDDTIFEKLAKIRGIKDIKRFLSPTKDEMFDPYLIKNIEEASNKILKAMENGEKILLSYDADADGLTSTSMMYKYLKNYTDNVDYIYNERNHGHGINEQTRLNFLSKSDYDEHGEIIDEDKKRRYKLNRSNLDKISEADLLIIIDSSSNDTNACKKLIDTFGVDIVIIDHHAIERENPHVLLVNPQQEGDKYPNKYLSGAGVVFKTIEVMEDMLGDRGVVNPIDYMDLVAVGMYADVMKMDVYENRFMVMHGLRNIRNVGLKRILKGAKADLFKLDGDSIGFSIAPLLNGVARLDNIKLGIDILLTDDDNEAKKLRLKMHKLNEKRKEMQKEIVERYEKKVDTNNKIIMIIDEESSKGFNGLVSQQLVQKYKRPAIVGRLHNGEFSGSFRSYNGFNLLTFLNESGLVEEAMGHPQAGGFVIKEERVSDLIKYIDKNIPELDHKDEFIYYDLEFKAKEIDNDLIKIIESFNLVTGNGFDKVLVKVTGIMIDEVNTIGKTLETRKFSTYDNLELIKFKVDESYGGDVGFFDVVDVIGQLQNNEWYNFKTREKIVIPQIRLEDYVKADYIK